MTTGLEEKAVIVRKKTSQLAKQIAHWHIYFFNTTQKEFSAQVVKDLEPHNLDYNAEGIRGSLFKITEDYKVNPIVTNVVVNIFNKANGKSYSRSTIEKLVNDFDDMHTGGNPDIVDWNIARPVVDQLIALEGKSFYHYLPDYDRKKLENGIRNLHVKDYSRLKRRLEGLPHYGFIQVLSNIGDILQNEGPNTIKVATIFDLPKKEELVEKGKKNYGEEAFMEHIFPVYNDIRKEHGFPNEWFERVVKYPENPEGNHKSKLDAESIGKGLQEYKTILDHNKQIQDQNRFLKGKIGGVTNDGISNVFQIAEKYISQYTWNGNINDSTTPV